MYKLLSLLIPFYFLFEEMAEKLQSEDKGIGVLVTKLSEDLFGICIMCVHSSIRHFFYICKRNTMMSKCEIQT